MQGVATRADTTASRQSATAVWPWAFIAGGVLFLIGGALHPGEDSSLPEEEATAEFIGAGTWVPAHALIVAGTIGFMIGLFALARSSMPSSPAARRAAWVAALAAVLLVVEGAFHLAAFVDEDAARSGAATPVLSTHMVMSLIIYPLFTLALAALALLSGRTLTHPVVGVLGAIGAIAFGVAPALVGPAGIDSLAVLFGVGGILMSLWFIVVGVSALIRASSRRRTAALPS